MGIKTVVCIQRSLLKLCQRTCALMDYGNKPLTAVCLMLRYVDVKKERNELK